MRRARRGQAVTELAVGSLLLVTVTLFAIYFGEVEMMILKVQEAGNFALWDGAGRRVHSYVDGAVSYGPFASLPTATENATQNRYKDFLGTGTPATGRRESHAEGRNLTVSCQRDDALTFDVVPPGGQALRYPGVLTQLERYNQPGTGGVTCQVGAELRALRITEFFGGTRGYFRERHVKRPSINVCATRWCNGQLGILYGTWALEGPSNHRNNAESQRNLTGAQGGPNTTYFEMTRALFEANGRGEGGPARRFAETIADEAVPYDENSFWMSYRGVESDYGEPIDSLSGHMHQAGQPTPQRRYYDTNGAPMEKNNPTVYEWEYATRDPAVRDAFFLGMPKHRP